MPNEDATPRQIPVDEEALNDAIEALRQCAERPELTPETKKAIDDVIVAMTCFSGGTNPPTPC